MNTNSDQHQRKEPRTPKHNSGTCEEKREEKTASPKKHSKISAKTPHHRVEYIPQKQDIIWIDFNPAKGREIQKRRPALVVSSDNYNKQTGFVAVCPITHGQKKLQEKGLLIPVPEIKSQFQSDKQKQLAIKTSEKDLKRAHKVTESAKVTGYINPFQLHTFDFRARNAQKISELDDFSFAQVVQLYRFIFE